MKLSIVIPVYNEEKTITDLVSRVEKVLENLPEAIKSYEFIIVDDASKDNTKKILEENFSSKENFTLFSQTVNQGKGAAITKGFSLTTGDIVIVQDADLEYDPNDYTALFMPIINKHADVVYGSRFKGDVTQVHNFWHYMGNKFLTLISNMFTDLHLTDMETCYKVFKGNIIRNMILTSNRFGIEPEMTAKLSKVKKIQIFEIPISYYGRSYAEGKKIGWRDGISAIRCIFKFNLFTSYEESFKIKEEDLLLK